MIVFGGILWLLCFVTIAMGWYARLHRTGVSPEAPVSPSPDGETAADDDNGRGGKGIKLVMQKDGTFVAKEVEAGADENPWDEEGIDDFSFTDTEGRTVTKSDLVGKPFVISFVFTQCRGPCPRVTLEMRELQDRLKDYDFRLVTLTVDPERDTAAVLKQYAQANGADFNRWMFLTGDQMKIYLLIKHSFKMPVEEVQGPDRQPGLEIIHSTNIMLVNENGRVVGKFDARKDERFFRRAG